MAAHDRALPIFLLSVMMQAMLRKIRLLADRQASLSVSYLLYTVALGFSGLIQLGLLFLLARKLPAPEFGVVALLMIAIPLVSRFVTLGSDIGLAIRIWKRPREEQQADLNAMLAWTAANTAAVVLAAALVWPLAGFPLPTLFPVCALLAAAFRSCAEMLQAMLQREGRTAQVGLVIVFRALLFGGVCATVVVFIEASSYAYLFAVLAAEGLTAFWAVFRLHAMYGLRLANPGSFTRMKSLVRVGFPAIPGMAAALLLAAGDRFVITAVLGLTATGIYALGQRLAEAMVQMLFVPFSRAFGPVALGLAARNESGGLVLIGRTALAFGYVGGAVLGLPAVVAREVILGFAGHEYEPAALIFLLTLPAVLIYQMSQIVAVHFSHTEQLHRYVWIIVLAATANIVTNFAAVHAFGIYGAAMTSLVMFEAVLVATAMTIRRGGVTLAPLRHLHAPLMLFGLYLAVIFGIDALTMPALVIIPAKLIIWAALVALSVAASVEMRDAISGMLRRLRTFIAA